MFDTDWHESPVYVTYRSGINAVLVDGYEVDDDRQTSTKNKPRDIGQVTDQTRYE